MLTLVVKVMVKAGDVVEQDQPVLIMEAMKMEVCCQFCFVYSQCASQMVLKAPRAGTVARVNFEVGGLVGEDAALVVLESEED